MVSFIVLRPKGFQAKSRALKAEGYDEAVWNEAHFSIVVVGNEDFGSIVTTGAAAFVWS